MKKKYTKETEVKQTIPKAPNWQEVYTSIQNNDFIKKTNSAITNLYQTSIPTKIILNKETGKMTASFTEAVETTIKNLVDKRNAYTQLLLDKFNMEWGVADEVQEKGE